MPKRKLFASGRAVKRFRKTLRRRRTARRRRGTLRLKRMVNTGLGFPLKQVKTLRYADLISVTSTTGIKGVYNFSANGLFDPDITGTGHQPMFFDQMMAIYNHYAVIGAKIEIRGVPGSSNTSPMSVILNLNDDTTAATGDINAVQEQSLSSRLKICHVGETNPFRLVKKYSSKKVWGKGIMANGDLHGDATANPLEQTYFQIVVQTVGATTTSISFQVLITYIAVFFELKDVGQS